MNKAYFPATLYDAYRKIRSCRLVARREVDDDSVKHFEHYLNASIPSTEREIGAKEVVRACFQTMGYKAYFKLIKTTKMECCILYLDPRSIITFLGIIGLVYVNESEDEVEAYTVQVIKRQALRDVLEYKPISWIEDVEKYIKERDARMVAAKELMKDVSILDDLIASGVVSAESAEEKSEATTGDTITTTYSEVVQASLKPPLEVAKLKA